MYFYTHVLTDVVLGEYSSGTEQASMPAINASASFQAATGSTISYSGVDQGEGANLSSSGFTSYVTGTQPRSVTRLTASSTTADGLTNSSTSYAVSGTGTFTIAPIGSSTGVDTFSWSQPATQTTVITAAWTASRGTIITQLTASASATTSNPTSTVSATASGTTLVPIYAIDRVTAQRWYVAKQHPPPLRRAAWGFAITGDTSSGVVATLAVGTNSYLSDFAAGTSLSTDDFDAGSSDYTYSLAFSSTLFSGRSISASSSAAGQISAARLSLSGGNVVWSSTWGQGLSVSPDVSGLNLLAGVAENLSSISVWTTPSVHAQTSFCWSYLSSSWILHASSLLGTSTSTYTVGVSVTGSPQTATEDAVFSFNADPGGTFFLSSAILGPAIPAETLGLNAISVSSLTGTAGVHAFSTGRLSAVASSGSKTFSSSASEQISCGVGSAFPLTYDASLLSMAARIPALTVETATFRVFGATNLSAPPLFSANLWNEAAQADPYQVST